MELLETGAIDIGLIGAPKQSNSLVYTELQTIQDTFVTTRSYLDNLSIREPEQNNLFSTGTLMLLDEENITRQFIDDYFYRNQIKTNQILEVSTMDLLIEFARIGLGIACVIREFVEQDLKQGTLIELPLSAPIENRSIGLAYAKSHTPASTVLEFLNYMKTSVLSETLPTTPEP